MSFDILEGRLGRDLCDATVRAIWLDIREHGLPPDSSDGGRPDLSHLNGLPEIAQVAAIVKRWANTEDEMLSPQIIWHMPDRAPEDMKPWPHVDEPPKGKRYTKIAGVPLTDWDRANGGLVLWLPGEDEEGKPTTVTSVSDLWPGDIIFLSPDQEHSPGINRSAAVRVGLYFRWVEPARKGRKGRKPRSEPFKT